MTRYIRSTLSVFYASPKTRAAGNTLRWRHAVLETRCAGDMSTCGGLRSHPLRGLTTRSLRELKARITEVSAKRSYGIPE